MRSSRSLFYIAPILMLVVIVSYSNHFQNDFHFDDGHTVVNNVYIRDIGNIPFFFKDATTSSSLPQNQSYRPVVYTTLALDYWLGKGLKPFYFHLSTFILFVTQGILMFFLFLRVFDLCWKRETNRLIALLAVAWYLLHPANAETVNYVIARSDLLSTLFMVVAFVAFAYFPVCRKWHLYLVPAALAILAKPVAAIFSVLFLVYLLLIDDDIVWRKLPERHSWLRHLAAVLPCSICCALTVALVGKMTPPSFTTGGASFFHYVITQPYVILRYFGTFFLPIGLSADTDWQTLKTIADARFVLGCLFIASLLLTAFAAVRSRKLRPISFGLFWFFFALVPTSLTPLAEVTNDHRMFFPFIGLAMSITWALDLGLNWGMKFFSAKPLFRGMVSVFVTLGLIACAWGTHERNRVWRSEETLWHDVTIKSPQNGRGLMNYGLALMAKADYSGAENYFTRGLVLLPNYSYLYVNLGILKAAAGKTAEAEKLFLKALSLNAANPETNYWYGQFLRNQNRLPEALTVLYKTLQLAPAHPGARQLLMEIHYLRSEFRNVIEIADETLRITPGNYRAKFYLESARSGADATAARAVSRTPEEYLDLSLRYYREGLYQFTIESAREALKLKPDYDLAYNNICSAYNGLKMWDKAIEAGQKAVELNPANQLAKNNLKWAKMQKER